MNQESEKYKKVVDDAQKFEARSAIHRVILKGSDKEDSEEKPIPNSYFGYN